MIKLIASLGVAAAAFAMANSAFALNPQPLPPFQVQGMGRTHKPVVRLEVRRHRDGPTGQRMHKPYVRRTHKPFDAHSGLPVGKRMH